MIKVYAYGAREPVSGQEEIWKQLRLAHQYRNACVQKELERRQRLEAEVYVLSPRVLELRQKIDAIKVDMEKVSEEISAKNQKARKRLADPEAFEKMKALRASFKDVIKEHDTLRKGIFKSPEFVAGSDARKNADNAAARTLRSEFTDLGLYWGTYLLIERSAQQFRKGPPPKFRSWKRGGNVAIQIQAQSGEPPFTMKEAEEGTARISLGPPQKRGNLAPLRMLKLRVGGDRKTPTYAEIPIYWHRDPPVGGIIRWVVLRARAIACTIQWEAQFTVEGESSPLDRAETGIVGIDMGWRKVDQGLRVAAWHGSDGDQGTLILPQKLLDKAAYSERLRSIRDKIFNDVRDRLATWLSANADIVPLWLKEATESIRQWRSQSRLAATVLRWRENRFTGDEFLWPTLPVQKSGDKAAHDRLRAMVDEGAVEAWRKIDRHLYEWERHNAEKCIRQRREIYRIFAAQLRRKYKKAVIEKMDKRDFHELPNVEDASTDGALRTHVRIAALSVLTTAIVYSMSETVQAPAAYTTMTCSTCNKREDFDRSQVFFRCSSCGTVTDQDDRAAMNLMNYIEPVQEAV